jgi:S-formylglutathione hydrolase FrmB
MRTGRAYGTGIIVLIALSSVRAAEPLPVKTVEFDGPSVGRKMKYNIVVPAGYELSSERRFPVLYLLHGYSSNYTAWARLSVPRYAARYDLIVVMPDAGNSWYVNWAESKDDQKNQWEDHMIKDLVSHIDATYRTIAAREGRAINGLSMGGFGALMLGLRHPDMFCSIGSHSGAVGFARGAAERLKSNQEMPARKGTPSNTPNPAIGIEGFSSQAERSPKGKLFAKLEDCEAHDPFKLVLSVPREKLPHIYIDCGTEDRLIRSNQDLIKLLIDNKIPFTYGQSPGEHNGAYWTREVGHSMAVQYQILERNLAARERAKRETEKSAQ